MRLASVKIDNYRNLDGVEVTFHPISNFLVGESNLGKSNLLKMLNTIFSRSGFADIDFSDYQKPIEISLTLSLDQPELGLFEDLFDPESANNINIIARQESADDYLQFFHAESGSNIPPSSIKCLNFIYYDSMRIPAHELTFDKRRGVGKFLNHLLDMYIQRQGIEELSLVRTEGVADLLTFINEKLAKLRTIEQYSISAKLEEDSHDILARIVSLKDENGFSLQGSGYGIQFISLICLAILESLLNTTRSKNKKGIFKDDEGKSCYPLIMGLDEPEIHLHPYMQRSLVKYLTEVISNKDSLFLNLISEIFGIDRILGQIIIATHSPNILLSNYKQIVRLHRSAEGCIVAKSGQTMILDQVTQKQLLRNMPYIREAFFSKCVILVEGDTELGAFPIFAEKLGVDMDQEGISVIQAGSAGSIEPLMKLLDKLGIPSFGLMDKDNWNAERQQIENLFFTDAQDFEDEIVAVCMERGKERYLKAFVAKNDPKRLKRKIDKKKLNAIIKKYNLDLEDFDQDCDFRTNDTETLRVMLLAWMDINKSIVLGTAIAEWLPESLIPRRTQEIFEAAEAAARNV